MKTMNNILVNNINEYDSINNHDNYIRDSSNNDGSINEHNNDVDDNVDDDDDDDDNDGYVTMY